MGLRAWKQWFFHDWIVTVMNPFSTRPDARSQMKAINVLLQVVRLACGRNMLKMKTRLNICCFPGCVHLVKAFGEPSATLLSLS